ncbi:anthrone oxygenase family protein [Amycolatopsis sp. lyj-90]|uniref:anthrone oxygenase family protein n=1 Tax=Amycolatopsis sp. lyj-90 TaxID=2789285 RepID=UPI00397A9191
MLQALVPLVLLMNGLAAGVLLGSQLGAVPLMKSMPAEGYVYVHAFFSTRYDPFMPACLIGTSALDVVFGLSAGSQTDKSLFFVAGGLALGTVAISIAKNVPVNKWVRTLDPDNLPADFGELDPRSRWGFWNLVRTVLAVGALVLNCVAVAWSYTPHG